MAVLVSRKEASSVLIIIMACPRMVNIYKTKQNRMEWDGLFELQIQHLPLIYSLKSSHILCPLFYFFLIKLCCDIFLFVGFFCGSLFFPNRHNPLLPQILCVNDYKNTYLKKKNVTIPLQNWIPSEHGSCLQVWGAQCTFTE